MEKIKKIIAFGFFGLVFFGTPCMCIIESFYSVKGKYVRELTKEELTAKEKETLPFLFPRTKWIAVQTEDGKIEHVIKQPSVDLIPGQNVAFCNMFTWKGFNQLT